MDELGRELAGALKRAEEEGRRSRLFGELAGSIDLDEVLSRALEATGALEGADAALVMLPDTQGGKPLVATLGLSVEEAERHAITGPPDGRLARSISMPSRTCTTGATSTRPWRVSVRARIAMSASCR